jgi:hypothetical protein
MDVEVEPRAAMDHAYFSLRDRDAYSPRELFETGFRRGAQWAIRRSGELSPHVAHFIDFVTWLAEDQPGQDVWDQFVELPPVEPTTNGTGDESDPW